MREIINEVLIYLCYLTMIYLVTYSSMNANSFDQVDHLRKFFLNSRQIDGDYMKVSDTRFVEYAYEILVCMRRYPRLISIGIGWSIVLCLMFVRKNGTMVIRLAISAASSMTSPAD
jgi:hypothetical protein